MGLDRLVMMALGAADVRSGIAFPKSLRGRDEMSGAPCPVPAEKLLQVGLQRAEDA